jgi:hypothetical protein
LAVSGAGHGAPAIGRAPGHAIVRTACRLAVAAFLLYAVSGGGRIIGSDEYTMFELSRALLSGHIEVPVGATLTGPDGRTYTKNAAGQAVLALPLVALGEGAARASGLDPARQRLAARFVASFFNAIVTAVLLAVFYAGVRRLGVGAFASLAAALMLGFTTPLWVYAKSFMAEPLEALGLFLALIGVSFAGESARSRGIFTPERIAGLGVCIAVSAKLSMLPLAIGCMAPIIAAPRRSWIAPALGLIVALTGHAVYDAARFGTPLETGYGAQATPAAYTTPLLVGLYGLLISSGKGVLWFAPVLWLVPSGWRAMRAAARGGGEDLRARLGLARPAGRAAWGAAIAAMGALLLYGRFQHWAGDGSFGPRYLIPVMPLVFIPVGFALEARRTRRAIAIVLAALGLLVQLGGVAIYFGAQMREAGDYPYTLPLDHPRFMSDSHFNPRFSPIAGHWRLLTRNVREHLRGQAPRMTGAGAADPRVGVGAEDQRALLHGLDFWWLYLGYAGLPRAPVLAAVVALLALAVWAAARTRSALAEETHAP